MHHHRLRRVVKDYNDESIFALVEKTEEEYVKSPRYQSIHKKRMKCELARVKSSHKTLGQPKVPLNPPSDFLKKYSRIVPKRPKITHVHYRKPDYIRELPKWTPIKPPEKPCVVPPLPKDPALIGRVNFKKRNVEEVKKYEKKPQKFKTVDTRMGDVQELVPSGLMPIYIYKKNFGQVPEFSMPKEFNQLPGKKCGLSSSHYEKQEQKSIPTSKSVDKKPACRYVTEEERKNLLDSMMNKQAEMMKTYQCLPFLIDTPAKIKRKRALENKLKQLEKDIELIENHQYIYVYNG